MEVFKVCIVEFKWQRCTCIINRVNQADCSYSRILRRRKHANFTWGTKKNLKSRSGKKGKKSYLPWNVHTDRLLRCQLFPWTNGYNKWHTGQHKTKFFNLWYRTGRKWWESPTLTLPNQWFQSQILHIWGHSAGKTSFQPYNENKSTFNIERKKSVGKKMINFFYLVMDDGHVPPTCQVLGVWGVLVWVHKESRGEDGQWIKRSLNLDMREWSVNPLDMKTRANMLTPLTIFTPSTVFG